MLAAEALMRGNHKLALIALAAAGLCIGGCAPKQAAPPPHPGVISEHLLFDLDAVEADQLSLDPYMILAEDWQALVDSRKDDRLGSSNGAGMATVEWLEIRQRDFQRTVNGRPREYSTTYTTTIRRGFAR
jgi:hypothetical protein